MNDQLKPLHLNREWLHQKYAVELLSTYEIGRIVGRNPKNIYAKLRDFGIQTRPRGVNLKSPKTNYMKRVVSGELPNVWKGKKHSEESKARISKSASKPKPHLRGKSNGMYGRFGDKNPRYIDGSSPERQRVYASSKWKEIVRAVYKRDGYTCARCSLGHSTESPLNAHHIKPWAGNPEFRYDANNLITLCRDCHIWVHSSKNISNDYLELA